MVLRKRCRRPIHAIERAFLAFEIDGGWSVVVCSNSSVLEKADQTTPYLLCAFDIALGKGKSYAENANRDRKRREETRRDETRRMYEYIQTWSWMPALPYDPRSISVAIYEQVICKSGKY